MEHNEPSVSTTLESPPRHWRVQEGAGAAGGNGHEDHVDLNIPRASSAWVVAAAFVGIVGLAALLLIGLIPRHESANELAADAANAANAPVIVNVAHAQRGPSDVTIKLPGTLRPWQEVSIFARTT